MHRFILWQVIIILFLFIPFVSYASDVTLNEIFANPQNEEDEFIEIYNNSDTEVDLSGWVISDLIKSYTIVDLKMFPKGFLVLEKSLTGIALNNSNEKVTLSDKDSNPIDAFSYETTIEESSLSRSPDGTGNFSDGTAVTKGTSNAGPPSLTPTPTLKPTKIPTPTKEPSPTRQPSVAKSPTTAADLKEKDNGDSGPSITKRASEVSRQIVSVDKNSEVKGASEEYKSEPSSEENDNPQYLYSVTTGVGMLILGCAIILYRRFKAKKEDDDF